MGNIVILGNGIAGYSAAKEIRKYDKNTSIIMISEENSTTYLRPLLSKTYFKTFQKEKIRLETDAWYEEQGIQLILGTKIMALHREEQCVELENGMKVSYDSCVYAMGASCFVPPFTGKDKKGVMVVRTFKDFDDIRRRLYTALNVVVIGGGVIGLEMAWELKQMYCDLAILEAGPWVMGRLLDEQSATVLSNVIREQGITVEADVNIKEITGDESVTGVFCVDGSWYPADVVIVSCGVRANSQVAREAGLHCDRGVVVNEYMRTSDPCIYAAGDCMQASSSNPSLWTYAKVSGETAGYNLCHPEAPKSFIAPPSSVILSGFGTNLFSIGDVSVGEEIDVIDRDGKKIDRLDRNVKEIDMIDRDELDRSVVYRDAVLKDDIFIDNSLCKNKSNINEREDGCQDIGFSEHRFRVNEPKGAARHYERRFYHDGKLQGAVLLGDLSQMAAIKEEMELQ